MKQRAVYSGDDIVATSYFFQNIIKRMTIRCRTTFDQTARFFSMSPAPENPGLLLASLHCSVNILQNTRVGVIHRIHLLQVLLLGQHEGYPNPQETLLALKLIRLVGCCSRVANGNMSIYEHENDCSSYRTLKKPLASFVWRVSMVARSSCCSLTGFCLLWIRA